MKNIRVVLVRTSHPGNIGAAARAIKTMGLSDLHLVLPRSFPHPDAIARASGAVDVLQNATVHDDLEHALKDCVLAVATSARRRELRHELLDPRAGAGVLLEHAAHHKVALVFGNEATGLTREEAALCPVWATIPSDETYGSLNLAAAVQVFAYELRMAVAHLPELKPEFESATLDQVEQLYRHFEQTMTAVEFFDPAHPKRLLPRLRRMLARGRLESEEVDILRGFLKTIDRAIGTIKKP